jgi:outer membrane protein, heavy metal efflux system
MGPWSARAGVASALFASTLFASASAGLGCGAPRAHPALASDADRVAAADRAPRTHARASSRLPSAPPRTLEELLAYADRNAPAMRIAEARVEAGAAELEGAGAIVPYNPELALSGGGRTVDGTSRFEMEAELEQRFQIAGQRGTRLDAAEGARELAAADLDVARWRLHADVHALYDEVLLRRAQRVSFADLVKFAEATHDIIQRRIAAGEESPLTETLARAEIAEARQAALRAELLERDAELRLAQTIGWPMSTPLAVEGELAPPRQPPTLAEIKAKWAAHPALRRAAEATRLAALRVEVEDRAAYPDPAIGLRYAREAEPVSPAHVWMATLKIPIPLFERNQAGRARARADHRLARAELEAFEAQLESELHRAVARAEAAAARAALYGSDILPTFEAGLERLARAYELGEIDVLELSQLRQRLLRTREDALDALFEYYQAIAELEALSGMERNAASHDVRSAP